MNTKLTDKTQAHIEKKIYFKINRPGDKNHKKVKKNFSKTL